MPLNEEAVAEAFELARTGRERNDRAQLFRAAAELKRALQAAPRRSDILSELATIELELDELASARGFVTRYEQEGGSLTGEMAAVAADVALRDGDPTRALTLAERALELVPESCRALLVKALSLRELQMPYTASIPAGSCRRPQESAGKAYLLGLMLIDSGLRSDAAPCFRRANARDPGGRFGVLAAEQLSELEQEEAR